MAAGVITFKQVGTELPKDVVSIPFQQAVLDGKKIKGIIAILDVQYGNVWTNIPAELFNKLNVKVGNKLHIVIYKNKIKNMKELCRIAKPLVAWQKESYWPISTVCCSYPLH